MFKQGPRMDGWEAEVVIRTALRADLGTVLELEQASPTAPHWSPAEYLACVEWNEASGPGGTMLRRQLLVATKSDRVVGFAVAKVITLAGEVIGEVESVVVEQTMQRRGIGASLCMAAVQWCRRRAASAVELEVRSGSEGAIALYDRIGFVVEGQRRGYYHDPVEDAVLMRLVLHDVDNVTL